MKSLLDRIKARLTKKTSSGRASFGFGRRHAGVYVSEENALTYSAIWRCVNLISQSIGALPWAVNERTFDSNGRKSSKRLPNHPAQSVLGLSANPEQSSQHWRETLVAWALTYGNGYAEIERDRANRVIALWPVDPSRVTVERSESGELFYLIKNGTNQDTALAAEDVFHLRGLGFDGLTGYSVISFAARTIGLGLATEDFGADFFGNGAHVGGVFNHPNQLGDEAIKHLKESIKERQGGKNQLSPMVLEEGMTYTPTSIPPNDAQFLETRKFNIAEVARWYGVPLHKLMEMDAATFSNIEHQSIEFVQDALVTWVKRLETEANIKLVSKSNRGRIYTKLNLNSLLRGDTKTRGEYYQTMSNLGVFSINDIRELEDLNPIGADGDKRLVQLNLTTLDKVGEVDQVQAGIPEKENDEESEDDQESEGTDSDNERLRNTARPILVRAFQKCNARTNARAKDAIKRYEDDRDGLIKWMDKYFNQHEKYIHDQIDIQTELLGIDTVDYVKEFNNETRLNILASFDGNKIYDWCIHPVLVDRLLGDKV